MDALPLVDLLGYWLGIFLTLCIISFLYKDNPFYKAAEHLFIGVSIGYIVIQQYYNTLRPKLVEEIAAADHWWLNLTLIPLLLVIMMFVKAISPRLSWMGRYPLAFVVAFYAGLQINGVTSSDIGAQTKAAMDDPKQYKVDINTADRPDLSSLGLPPQVVKAIMDRREQQRFESLDQLAELPAISDAQRADIEDARGHLMGIDALAATKPGQINWFGTFSAILMFLGLIASLIYFYFSAEHKGVLGRVSRFGVWVLMIGFGASFGFTVMGRLALMIGRVQEIKGDTMDPELASQIHGPWVALASIVIIAAGLVVWELRNRRKESEPPSSGSTSGE